MGAASRATHETDLANTVLSTPANALGASRAIQSDASALGFDWPGVSGVLDKVREEVAEIEEAARAGDLEHARCELGDLLFATVNLARFLDGDPGEELHKANLRFVERFDMLKEEIAHEGRAIADCTLAELDVVWERVKERIASRAETCA